MPAKEPVEGDRRSPDYHAGGSRPPRAQQLTSPARWRRSEQRGVGRMIAGLRRAARAVLRRPPSDWAGPDAARAAISRASPIEADDRFDVVCLPGGQESAALRRLSAEGHRVLFPAAADLSFASLDRTRRDLGLGATVSIVARSVLARSRGAISRGAGMAGGASGPRGSRAPFRCSPSSSSRGTTAR